MPEPSQQLIVCRHPLLDSALADLRNEATDGAGFRAAMDRIAAHLVLAATQDWPTVMAPVATPLVSVPHPRLDPGLAVWVVPILRAGLALCPVVLDWLPMATVYHLGVARNETTLQPEVYYNNLPAVVSGEGPLKVLVLDPMLATGGSACWALAEIVARGVAAEAITLVTCIAAPEGVAAVARAFPGGRLVTAALDERLTERGYIVPGLGDAGDRFFGM